MKKHIVQKTAIPGPRSRQWGKERDRAVPRGVSSATPLGSLDIVEKQRLPDGVDRIGHTARAGSRGPYPKSCYIRPLT